MVAAENSSNAENLFVHLKVAQDTLINPVKRFAYERFGPDMLDWQHCSSIRDYLFVGLQAALPLYAGSIIVLVIVGVMGYFQWGRFVRYKSPIPLSEAYRKLKKVSTVALPNVLRSFRSRIPHSNTALPSPFSLEGHQSRVVIDNTSPAASISVPNPCA